MDNQTAHLPVNACLLGTAVQRRFLKKDVDHQIGAIPVPLPKRKVSHLTPLDTHDAARPIITESRRRSVLTMPPPSLIRKLTRTPFILHTSA